MNDDLINIGDSVYIGGLFHDGLEEINNNIGKVAKIYIGTEGATKFYVAEIHVNGYSIDINFDYLFKIDENKIDEELLSPSLVADTIKKLNIRDYTAAYDGYGQYVSFCLTYENNQEFIMMSLLN
jgi:hypothetical protein